MSIDTCDFTLEGIGVSLYGLSERNLSFKGGAQVEITGRNIRKGLKLGLGVVKVLSAIPAAGDTLGNIQARLTDQGYLPSSVEKWLREDLIPNDLVSEIRPGFFINSKMCASYRVFPEIPHKRNPDGSYTPLAAA